MSGLVHRQVLLQSYLSLPTHTDLYAKFQNEGSPEFHSGHDVDGRNESIFRVLLLARTVLNLVLEYTLFHGFRE